MKLFAADESILDTTEVMPHENPGQVHSTSALTVRMFPPTPDLESYLGPIQKPQTLSFCPPKLREPSPGPDDPQNTETEKRLPTPRLEISSE
jgi:hypothetical protein